MMGYACHVMGYARVCHVMVYARHVMGRGWDGDNHMMGYARHVMGVHAT
jgi:hypothetical protein